ncbi:MAG TPA: ABC transporter ATP-binding protein [Bacilli bacterium]|jgi:ATP-binding cassette subfamily B protein|nr:ABC transporter ATP-binding protein [Acholeplasmataceae bacterium]HOA79146.1 ABC transporter ATP-binding protein [Bacilli bacterium]HPZ27836.1 ABC transporter ATP-binding protein [Bacilli bacterium]HQC90215.1 ABC transporter ATP-binding protein [Bacilli bacterium]
MKKRKGFIHLIKWAIPYVPLLIVIVLCAIISPFTYSYVPQFTKYVVDYILSGKEGSTTLPSFLIEFYKSIESPLTAVTIVVLSLVLYQLARGIIIFIDGYSKGRFAENVAYDMRNKLYTHIQSLSYQYHNNADTGDLIQRCTSDVDTVKSFLSSQLPQLLFIITSIAAGAYQLSRINTGIMLVTIIVLPLTLTFSIFYYAYVKKKFEEIEEVEADMTTVLQENVNGVRVVKAFNNEIHEVEKFEKRNAAYRDKNRKLIKAMAAYWGISDALTMLQYLGTVVYSIYLAERGLISSGDIIACLMYIGMLVWPIRGLGRIIGDFGKATVAASRVNEILAIPTEYVSDGTLEPPINGNIEFENVTFKFDDTDKHLLNGINLSIKAGETVAVIGKTGSGKSTIAGILVRLLDYDQGSVKIDGVELKDIKKSWIREHIGIILQDPFLYAASVFENIKIAAKEVDSEQVYRAAKIAAIHKDIVNFEEGYNTLVGEKGVTLSGGQKQRIAIARMLLLNKPVLIFDDSLSAVDTSTDLEIRKALKENNKELTSIIITHRITTAKEADKIIVLDNGEVTAVGTHQELAAREGLYKHLWEIQGALESEFAKELEKGEAPDDTF